MTHLRKLFSHESWASRRLLTRLREVPDLDPQVPRLFAHIQAGLKVWILRIRGENSRGMLIWPELSLGECEALIDENEKAYSAILAGHSEEFLERKVSYTNQHGLSYETAVSD